MAARPLPLRIARLPDHIRPGVEFGPVWSPDGTRLAFLDDSDRTVYVMNADGTGRRPVHPGGVQFVPAWQPHPDDDE